MHFFHFEMDAQRRRLTIKQNKKCMQSEQIKNRGINIRQIKHKSNSMFHIYNQLSQPIFIDIFIISIDMKITLFSLEQLTPEQKNRQNAFYNFLYERMIGHNDIYYSKFLKNQFTMFPVAKGYPIIGKNCNSPQCYFYVSYEQAKDLEQNFFKFLSREIQSLKCKCGNSIRKLDEFVYDSTLAGFLQLKLTDNQLSTLKSIHITINDEVYFENKGAFQECFNKARLKTISALSPQLTIKKQQKQQSQGSKTLKVNSYSIMHEIQQQIINSPLFVGKGKPQDGLMKEQDKLTAILPHFFIKESKGTIHMYKQTKEEQKFCSIALKIDHKLQQKLLQYYDFSQFTYYYLSIKGDLFKCDLRYMYNFLLNAYQLERLCSLSKLPPIDKQYSALLVRKQKIYVFCGQQGEQYVSLVKGDIKKQSNEIIMKPILQNKVRNRRGYSISWIKGNTLIQDQCIIIFGGIIEKVKNFKLLEIIGLGLLQEKYILHKITIRQEQFGDVSFCHPNISIFAGRLIVLGGFDFSQTQVKQNKNIAFIPLKQDNSRVQIKQILGEDKKEEIIEKVPGGTHVGEGWMIMMSKSNKRIFPIINRLRKLPNGEIQIQNIK